MLDKNVILKFILFEFLLSCFFRLWRSSGGRGPPGGPSGRFWEILGAYDQSGGWENSEWILQVKL